MNHKLTRKASLTILAVPRAHAQWPIAIATLALGQMLVWTAISLAS